MTTAKTEECLGRLSALKWFPQNPYALASVGEIIRDLCPTDADGIALVQTMLSQFDEWEGPRSLRETYAQILEGRRAAERARRLREVYVTAGAEREKHEATCPGYRIELDSEAHTVSATSCRESFGSADVELWHWLHCRKGEGFDTQLLKRLLQDELGARPGWVSLDAYLDRQFREHQQKLDTQRQPR